MLREKLARLVEVCSTVSDAAHEYRAGDEVVGVPMLPLSLPYGSIVLTANVLHSEPRATPLRTSSAVLVRREGLRMLSVLSMVPASRCVRVPVPSSCRHSRCRKSSHSADHASHASSSPAVLDGHANSPGCTRAASSIYSGAARYAGPWLWCLDKSVSLPS
ncbi:hypothetical protein EON67_06245 [archaeon]|nr:MAG: hypothetical protein EON67_06245 [archaeon]